MNRIKKFIRFIIAWFKIPKGDYCYTITKTEYPADKTKPPIHHIKLCPYWDRIEGLGDQECGYCHYLKRGDYDINNDPNIELTCTLQETGEQMVVKAPDMPFGIGLLWDQCKECGIKEE